jgi:hypothetical protein
MMAFRVAFFLSLLAFFSSSAVMAISATACEGGGGGPELTALSTKLSGEGKEGEELTVLEGAKVKDKATLTGKNASKATGKVTYKVYSEKECKTLVTTAGEVTVSGESVPASEEKELEAGKAYYWQAHYNGNSENAESTSPCTEILNIKAKTSLSMEVSGESKEAEELTIFASSDAEGKATLSGTNYSTATGKAVYDVYSDSKCEDLVTAAGEVTVASGKIPASSEEELEGNETYYWQVTYQGDDLHQESKSTCGKAILKVDPVCEKPYCEPTITPGVELKINEGGVVNKCTAGPIMKNGAELLQLTAGHCVGEGKDEPIKEEVKSAYPNKGAPVEKKIGSTGTFAATAEYDIAEVKIENAEWLAKGSAPPVLVEWEAKPKVTDIVGKAASKVGEKTCFTGAKSGAVHCGEILRTGATRREGPMTKNLVETTADSVGGDSGAPEFVRVAKGVEIQGVFVAGGSFDFSGPGNLTIKTKQITGFPTGKPGEPTTCEDVTTMKGQWPTVPIEGKGILAKTTVTNCTPEAGGVSTIEISANATGTAKNTVTVGYKELGWYEPMSQIEAKYPGQALLTK